MTLTTASITLAGLTLEGAKDDKGNYFVTVSSLSQATDNGESSVLRRRIRESKSLEALAGKRLETTNRRIGKTQVSMLKTSDLSLLLLWLSNEGNSKAGALLAATLQEALERRIDHALGVVVTEATRDERTKDNFREICRKEFQPEFTEWLKYDENSDGRPANYALCVNQLKKAAKLPLDTVDVYDQEQLRTWSKAITSYGNYRELGMNHKLALQKVTLKFDKP
jgi:hypothetical protein